MYGSKARGDATPDSDLDLLLIVKDRRGDRKRHMRRIGYLPAASSNVLPSILAYTESEWELRRRSASPFRRAVERDAIALQ